MKYTEKMSKKLNALLEKNYDAERGYRNAADDVDNDRLKEFFLDRAKQREVFAKELRMEILSFGEVPEDSGSATAKVHRAWMDLKSFFTSNNEESILEECVRGDNAAIKEYNEVLSEQATLPPTTVTLLTKQRDEIQASINNVKYYEDIVSS